MNHAAAIGLGGALAEIGTAICGMETVFIGYGVAATGSLIFAAGLLRERNQESD